MNVPLFDALPAPRYDNGVSCKLDETDDCLSKDIASGQWIMIADLLIVIDQNRTSLH
jgi:hypothetical protein